MAENISYPSVFQHSEPQKQRHHGNSRKRKKFSNRFSNDTIPSVSLEPIFIQAGLHSPTGIADYEPFEVVMDKLLPEYMQVRVGQQKRAIEFDQNGLPLIPLTKSEATSFINGYTSEQPATLLKRISYRKLLLNHERRRAKTFARNVEVTDGPVTPLPPSPSPLAVNQAVLDALHTIQTTPFENSFLSRLQGTRAKNTSGLIAVDCETTTLWMSLMNDIWDHYSLAYPDREQPMATLAPIIYTSLQEWHLPQVHDLLQRSFWTGIDVTDSLEYWPEKCTIVANYRKLVVGVAILSSPHETYITYLAVKAGWDKAQIASTMLYHLITLNPNKDITLHVSVNNSAMLLYNRFGFKAEEFVANLYEGYLDPMSRLSRNAFKLRLRQK